jgi:hypothetical protein
LALKVSFLHRRHLHPFLGVQQLLIEILHPAGVSQNAVYIVEDEFVSVLLFGFKRFEWFRFGRRSAFSPALVNS